MWRAFSGLNSPPAANRMLAIRRSESVIPSPTSTTSTTTPPSFSKPATTRTGSVGAE